MSAQARAPDRQDRRLTTTKASPLRRKISTRLSEEIEHVDVNVMIGTGLSGINAATAFECSARGSDGGVLNASDIDRLA
jgi:hypothetical protein